MLAVIIVWMAVVGLVITGYVLAWLLSPQLRAWMEAPRDQFLQQQSRFPRVVRKRPRQGDRAGLPSAPPQVPCGPRAARRPRVGAGRVFGITSMELG
jgi:hypothetical protein